MKARREIVPRSEYEYPQEVRAEAVALALAHHSYTEAAREMAHRYPERHPSPELIRYWVKQQEPDNFRALSDERKEAIVDRLEEVTLLTADKFAEEVRAGNIKGQQLAVAYGISADKALKLREIEKRSGNVHSLAGGNVLIVVNAQEPKTIEAEYEEVE